MVAQDEETMARVVTEDTLHALPLAFDKTNGSITAGSASTLSDGGAALVLMDLEYATAKNIPILAIIRGFGDAAQVMNLPYIKFYKINRTPRISPQHLHWPYQR